jgi:hypothetical protein
MINEATFQISIDESIGFLKELYFYKGRGPKQDGNHSAESKKVGKSNRHIDIYEVVIENKDYEILLFDDSAFQFSFSKEILRYSFIQNPNIFTSKVEYIASFLEKEEFDTLSEEQLSSYVEAINEDEYEQFLNEQELNLNANYIRYDMTELGYLPLIHSYSHIHIGLNPSFRVPSAKVLTPLSFVLFCVKHSYYKDWKIAVENFNNFSLRIKDCKSKCADLPEKFWMSDETFELYLT